jgi:hypothetical protein
VLSCRERRGTAEDLTFCENHRREKKGIVVELLEDHVEQSE